MDEVKVISKELIKPSSPTPHLLRHYQLSFLDQIAVPVFMPLVLFYPKETNNITNQERCNHAKKSLSKALTQFYPLAGRVKHNMYIDCNDEGAYFVEAEAKCTLSHILQHPDPNDLNKFLPLELDDVNDLASVFQVTLFQCGGLAISFGMSHKVGDSLSFFMFLNSWAAIARGDSTTINTVPCFQSSLLFPPKDLSGFQPRTGIVKDTIVAKRFVFDASTISALRAMYTDDGDNNKYPRRPTRVEALSAFIWSRFMASVEANKVHDSDKIYTLLHAINLRPRMDPPLQELYFGNISRIAVAIASMEDIDNICGPKDICGGTKEDFKNHGTVKKMRDAIRNVNVEYVKKLQESDGHLSFMKGRAEQVMKGEVVSFSFTSLCRFPIYEADFGWGKPVWVGSARLTFKNLVVFLDTKEGDGIEAWINLKVEDMVKFEADKEFLAHVSPFSNVKI
ncbi:stemmadenine O-acetyltransferase-like [Ricinus communis]|uniref:stemmadenine O-acetyltransferase-like n=1 Tax=Ricinus communis TaxID=3988 RepID=UPI00201A85E4|nr:stemmadenine O-acetyltransferase-like [Ricinus communis]